MTIQQMTTDKLLCLSDWIQNRVKLTQRGRNLANEHLSAIEWELMQRQPEGEFRMLLGEWNEVANCWREFVGFEPEYSEGI